MTDDLQKLLDEATPRPWELHGKTGEKPRMSGKMHIIRVDDIAAVFVAAWEKDEAAEAEANAALIALAPTLAARVIAAEKVVAAARDLADATQLALDHDYPEGADPLSRTRQALAAFDSLTTPSAPAPQST